MIAAWVALPVVLLLLTVGCGLLVDRLSGHRMPGTLLLPAGLALLIVVAQFVTAISSTAKTKRLITEVCVRPWESQSHALEIDNGLKIR